MPSPYYHINQYIYIKENLGNSEISKSLNARFEGCRPPRKATKGSMDRYFHVDCPWPKKIRNSGSTG